jgi:hypothetical protein
MHIAPYMHTLPDLPTQAWPYTHTHMVKLNRALEFDQLIDEQRAQQIPAKASMKKAAPPPPAGDGGGLSHVR